MSITIIFNNFLKFNINVKEFQQKRVEVFHNNILNLKCNTNSQLFFLSIVFNETAVAEIILSILNDKLHAYHYFYKEKICVYFWIFYTKLILLYSYVVFLLHAILNYLFYWLRVYEK